MAQKKYTDGSGVSEIWLNIKNYVYSQLLGKADSIHTHTKSQITDFPSFGNTAGTICEGNDSRLSDARTPTAHTHVKSEITDFPTLATVATSGSYNDLSDKPTIPTVNNATLTIQQNGTAVDTFTANSSSDKTVNIQCVDLTSNQTVGGIKTFSNAPVVNSIFLDGKTIDTDANDNLIYDSHIVDTIEEQGEGYIRYSSGIQICWGAFSGIAITPKTITFQKPFAAWNDTTVTFVGQNGPYVTQLVGLNTTQFLVNASADIDTNHVFSWQAIGRWK